MFDVEVTEIKLNKRIWTISILHTTITRITSISVCECVRPLKSIECIYLNTRRKVNRSKRIRVSRVEGRQSRSNARSISVGVLMVCIYACASSVTRCYFVANRCSGDADCVLSLKQQPHIHIFTIYMRVVQYRVCCLVLCTPNRCIMCMCVHSSPLPPLHPHPHPCPTLMYIT